MQPIQVPFGETFTILRGDRDRTGDRAYTDVGIVERCVFWQNVPVEPGGAYPATARDSATLTGTLAVPKGTDIRQADRARRESTGEVYAVLGPAQWDHLHPMTGWDTGYKTYTVKAVS